MFQRRLHSISQPLRAVLSTNSFQKRFLSSVLYGWGVGTDGQLGLGELKKEFKVNTFSGTDYRYKVPRKLLHSSQYQRVFVGSHCTFFLTESGELFGAGKGLVDFTGQDRTFLEPTRLPMPPGKIVDMSVGPRHAAVVYTDGSVYSWGDNGGGWFSGGGQLGLGHTNKATTPTLVSFLKDELNVKVSRVSCGDRHTLFLLGDGDVFAAGDGEYGRLGTGDNASCTTPAQINTENVPKGENIVAVSAGHDHSLALTDKGTVLSWGRNSSGQLGHGDSYMDMYSLEDIARPVNFPAKERITSVFAGNARSIALDESGRVWVWGARLTHEPEPLDKSLFKGQKVVQAICGGESSHSAFFYRTESGELWVSGDGSSDMLGISEHNNQREPMQLPLKSKDLSLRAQKVFAGCGQHVFVRAEL